MPWNPNEMIGELFMTALKYRKLTVISRFLQIVGCALLVGILNVHAAIGKMNLIIAIFATLFLLIIKFKSYVDIHEKGSYIGEYRIKPRSEGSIFACFCMVNVPCMLLPVFIYQNDIISTTISVLIVITALLLGIFFALPNKKDYKIIGIIEDIHNQQICLRDRNVVKRCTTKEDIQRSTQQGIYDILNLTFTKRCNN